MKVKIGKKLEAYHDGKISPSRMSTVEVVDVVSITDMSKKYLRMWKKAIVDDFNEYLLDGIMCRAEGPQRFFDWNCDKFIFAKIVGDKETEDDPIMFAKCPGGEWYGVNWNYLLDVDGRALKKNMPFWDEYAREEMGKKLVWNKKEHRLEYFDIKTGKKVEP